MNDFLTSHLITERSSYTFSDYFKLNIHVKDILAYFGYAFAVQNGVLPQISLDLAPVEALRERIEEILPYVDLVNETARREFLIAPVLYTVVHYTKARVRVEFPLVVNEQLKGTLDYFLQADKNLLVIEAKKGDMENGLTQLATELIALDKWLTDDQALLYGAVSIGNVWQLAVLDREAKLFTQEMMLYRVPTDLALLLPILVAILVGYKG